MSDNLGNGDVVIDHLVEDSPSLHEALDRFSSHYMPSISVVEVGGSIVGPEAVLHETASQKDPPWDY